LFGLDFAVCELRKALIYKGSWVIPKTPKAGVAGSIPAGRANKIKDLRTTCVRLATPAQFLTIVDVLLGETLPAAFGSNRTGIIKRILRAILGTSLAPMPKLKSMHEHGEAVSNSALQLIRNLACLIA
jgi:hypothetical protein